MSITCGCGGVVLKHIRPRAAAYFTSRNIHISSHKHRYFMPGDYYKRPKEEWSPELFQQGWKWLAKQPKKMWGEAQKKCQDPWSDLHPNETIMFHQFRGPSTLDNWIATGDSEWDEGFSRCSMSNTQQGYALFSGELVNKAPDTGTNIRGGYCTMRCDRPFKSFGRASFIDWSGMTHLVMRVRGDGRPYLVNLTCQGEYDIQWNTMWQYALFTRGGPYWQFTRIPFSKFFLAYRGRIQDRQREVPQHMITNVGFTMADGTNGPFNLEIDYIGVQWDPAHSEEFAYELYKTPKYVADE